MWDTKQAQDSARVFSMTIPIIEKQLNGKIINVENSPEFMAQLLDKKCGVDGLLIHNKGVYGIAHRVGYNKDWSTFTIRVKDSSGAKTEIDHLISTGIRPYYHVQSYVKGDIILSMAIARTNDIVDYIKRYSPTVKTAPVSGDQFTIINWYDFEKAGYKIKIIRGDLR